MIWRRQLEVVFRPNQRTGLKKGRMPKTCCLRPLAMVAWPALIASFWCNHAHAQGSTIDVEEQIRVQDELNGSGRLLGQPKWRANLSKSGLSIAALGISVTQLSDDGDLVSSYQSAIGARWQLQPGVARDATTLIGYFEHRGDLAEDSLGSSFVAGVPYFENPLPNDGFAYFRQAYLKQNLADDQIVVGFGKFAPRAIFNRSAVLGDKTRGFVAFPLNAGLGFTVTPEASGAIVRVQPTGSVVNLAVGVFDSTVSRGQIIDPSFDAPMVVAETVIAESHYKPDLETPPGTVLKLAGVYRESDGRGIVGLSSVLDKRLNVDTGLGVRLSWQHGGLSPEGALAAGFMKQSPFDRPRDAWGIGVVSTIGNDSTSSGVEAFYRFNVMSGAEISFDLQIAKPTDKRGLRGVGGVRLLAVL